MLNIMKYGMKFVGCREFWGPPNSRKEEDVPEPNMIHKFYFDGKFDKVLFSEFQVNTTSYVYFVFICKPQMQSSTWNYADRSSSGIEQGQISVAKHKRCSVTELFQINHLKHHRFSGSLFLKKSVIFTLVFRLLISVPSMLSKLSLRGRKNLAWTIVSLWLHM